MAEGRVLSLKAFLVVGRLSVPKNGNPSLVSFKKGTMRDWDIFFCGETERVKVLGKRTKDLRPSLLSSLGQ